MHQIKAVFVSVLTVLFFIWGCNKIAQLLTFRILNESSITVKSTTPINLPFEVATPDVNTNSSQEFQNNNTKGGLVKDIKLEELKLSITNPADKTFNFMKSIHLYISTGADDEIELAYADNISSHSSSISLLTTQAKLDKYVKASSYKLRTSVVTKETLTQDTDIKINLKFKVSANL